MTSPITCTNPASPASWSQIGYSITYNIAACGGTTPVNLTMNNYTNNTVLYYNLNVINTYSIKASLCFNTTSGSMTYEYGISTSSSSFDSFISLFVSSYYIMDFVNEVRTMQCSRVVYCSTTSGTPVNVVTYPTGTAGTLQLLCNSYIRVPRIA